MDLRLKIEVSICKLIIIRRDLADILLDQVGLRVLVKHIDGKCAM